jgi:hypothetical protein
MKRLHDIDPSQSIIGMIKSRSVKGVKHLAGVRDKNNACKTIRKTKTWVGG